MAFATTTDITQYWSEARRANFEPSLYLQIEHAQDANTWAAICRTLTWFNLVKLTGGAEAEAKRGTLHSPSEWAPLLKMQLGTLFLRTANRQLLTPLAAIRLDDE